jgi:LuxR family maltose regulon positive regulatory protein
MGLLERLLKAAEQGKRMGSVIEILVLQALAHHAQGDISRALYPLGRALNLAEPQGYVRIFVDEGPPMTLLLKQLCRKGVAVDYVAKILAACETTDGRRLPTAGEPPDRALSSSSVSRRPSSALVEPLSKRELEVLRLLGTELNGPEIARELGVALTTMRTHTQNIYGKLGVNNRRAAVRCAEELDLI